MDKKFVVAIDGPAGAGKSTIARLVAGQVGYAYIDTGAMYRAVTWKFLQSGHAFDENFIGGLSESMEISFVPRQGENCVYGDGKEITGLIRTQQINKLVSAVSAIPRVRTAMVAQQRRMGSSGGVILDGRDIGTVVFPRAELKIFLTASVEERAERRCREMLAKGMQADLQQVKEEIIQRDYQDSHRAVSPLKQAEDAYLLDTTGMTIEQVSGCIVNMIKELK